jgi:hypothetical protein
MSKNILKIKKVFLVLLFFTISFFSITHIHAQSNDIVLHATVGASSTDGGGGGGGGITVYAPTATPDPNLGPFATSTTVSFSSTNSASIHYSTNGDTPDCSSLTPLYTVPITISTSTVFMVIGCNGSYTSTISIFNYVINIPITVGTPVATPPAGIYSSTTTVTLTSTSSTSIHYTIDGSVPSCSSPVYSTGIIVSSNETIKAIGCNGTSFSSIGTFSYVIGSIFVFNPIATPPAGTYSATTTVTLTSTSSASIWYTIDGTDPVCPGGGTGGAGTVYASGIIVSSTETIKAIGCNGAFSSGVSTFNYVINITTPPHVFPPQSSLASGTYTGPQNITLSSTNSTSIHYSTGPIGTVSDPDCLSFSTYVSQIPINSSVEVKAIGCNGIYSSTVSVFNYVINPDITRGRVSPPQAVPPAGTYTSSQSVSLYSAGSTSIHYTQNGDAPTCSSLTPSYGIPIVISSSAIIKAIGCSDTAYSEISEFEYIIQEEVVGIDLKKIIDGGGTIIIATTTSDTLNKVIKVTNKVTKSLTDGVLLTQKVFTDPKNVTTVQKVAAVGVVVGSAASAISGLLFSAFSFADILLLPLKLWALILGLLGVSKRKKPWGTVYDSVTKQPLDPVYVVLRSEEGNDVATAITDLDGRYGFVIPAPGNYSIVVNKTNYQFPSQKLVGRDHDELYRDLYFGEHFIVSEAGEIVAKNVPMDPEKFDWNEFAKKSQHLMNFYSVREKWISRISGFIFFVGFTVSSLAVLFMMTKTNIVIFVLYIVLFLIRVFGLKSRPYGSIVSKDTGKPFAFAIIRISKGATGVEVMHRVTDAQGRYYCLLPNGEYVIRIDKKLEDGTYEAIKKDIPAIVTKGHLDARFDI